MPSVDAAYFVLDWWINDFVSIIARGKATQGITYRLRASMFEAIMRQDTVFFQQHDAGWVQDRLKRDGLLQRSHIRHTKQGQQRQQGGREPVAKGWTVGGGVSEGGRR